MHRWLYRTSCHAVRQIIWLTASMTKITLIIILKMSDMQGDSDISGSRLFFFALLCFVHAVTHLLRYHWIRPLHVNNCLVQLSYQIWPQKTTEGSLDCWASHWYNPPHSPGNVLIPSVQKGWQNPSGPLTSSTLPLWTVTVWSTLQSSDHQNDQTQKQFLNPSNPSHEHLTLNVEHTTLLYNYLFTTHTYFFISNLHMSDLTHNCLYCILCFCHFVHCLLAYLYIVLLLSVSCPVAVILLHCGASVTITNSSYV